MYDAETPAPVLDALLAGCRTPSRPRAVSTPRSTSRRRSTSASPTRPGTSLLLLNDDTELIEPASVEVLVGHLQTPDVAMAGAKLLFADGTLQHGGHVNSGRARPRLSRLARRLARPAAAAAARCRARVQRRHRGVRAGRARPPSTRSAGFTTELPLNYNDVDFCLKLRAAGHRIVWTPWAVWYHFESRTRVSRVLPEELAWLDARWHAELTGDPYYNPNLVPGRHDFLELPPPPGLPRREPA